MSRAAASGDSTGSSPTRPGCDERAQARTACMSRTPVRGASSAPSPTRPGCREHTRARTARALR
eukprot:11151715-Alexandrium_andersonii.AAC.1